MLSLPILNLARNLAALIGVVAGLATFGSLALMAADEVDMTLAFVSVIAWLAIWAIAVISRLLIVKAMAEVSEMVSQ